MNITIFILCHNEEIMLPHTIKHYKTRFPTSNIIIWDNQSDDKSVEIANSLGCKVISWNSNNVINDNKYRAMKNHWWKQEKGWVIVCDMDEWLDINEELLQTEIDNGTTILRVTGIQMTADSKTIDLSDLDLANVKRGYIHKSYHKTVCFYNDENNGITDINFSIGAHKSEPKGKIVWSKLHYFLKHMNSLGEKWCIDKWAKRSKRARSRYLTYPKNNLKSIKEYKKDYDSPDNRIIIFRT